MSIPSAVEPAAALPALTVLPDAPEARRFLERKRKVVIMGGGLSGLTTAYMLSRLNTRYNINTLDITLIESRDAVGGVIRSRVTPYGTFELGAPYADVDGFSANGKLFLDLIESVGLEHHLIAASKAPLDFIQAPVSGRFQLPTGGLQSFLSSLKWFTSDITHPRAETIPDMYESARSWTMDRAGLPKWDLLMDPRLAARFGCDPAILDSSTQSPKVRVNEEQTGSGLFITHVLDFVEKAPAFLRYWCGLQTKPQSAFQSAAAKMADRFSFRGGMQTLTDTLRWRCEQAGVRFVTGATIDSLHLGAPAALHSWHSNRFLDSGVEVGNFESGLPCRIRPEGDAPPLEICYRERSIVGAALAAVGGGALVSAAASGAGGYGSGVGGAVLTRRKCVPAHYVVNTIPGPAFARVLLRSGADTEALVLSSARRQAALLAADAATSGLRAAERAAAGGLKNASLRSESADDDHVVRLVESLEAATHVLSAGPAPPSALGSALRCAAAALTGLPIQMPPHPYSDYAVALRTAQRLRAADVAVGAVGVAHETPMLLAGNAVGAVALATQQRRRYALAHLARAVGLDSPAVDRWGVEMAAAKSTSGSAAASVWINDSLYAAVHEARRRRRALWEPSADVLDLSGATGAGVPPAGAFGTAPFCGRVRAALASAFGFAAAASATLVVSTVAAMLAAARWPDAAVVAAAVAGAPLTPLGARSLRLTPPPAALGAHASGITGIRNGTTEGTHVGAHVAPTGFHFLSSIFPQQRVPTTAAPAPVPWFGETVGPEGPADAMYTRGNSGTGRRVDASGVDRVSVVFAADPHPADPEDPTAIPTANLSTIVAAIGPPTSAGDAPRFTLRANGASGTAHVAAAGTRPPPLLALRSDVKASDAAHAAGAAAAGDDGVSRLPPPPPPRSTSSVLESTVLAAWDGAGRVLRPLLAPFRRDAEDRDNVASYPGSAAPSDRDYPELTVAAHLPPPAEALAATVTALQSFLKPLPYIALSLNGCAIAAGAAPTSPAGTDVLPTSDPLVQHLTAPYSITAAADGSLSAVSDSGAARPLANAVATGAPSGDAAREVVWFDYNILPEALPTALRGHGAALTALTSALRGATHGRLVCAGSHWSAAADVSSVVADAIEQSKSLEKSILRVSQSPIDLAQPVPLDPVSLQRVLTEPARNAPLVMMDADRSSLRKHSESQWRALHSKSTQELAQDEWVAHTLLMPGLSDVSRREATEYVSKITTRQRLTTTELISRRKIFAGPFEYAQSLRGGLADDEGGMGGWYLVGVTRNPGLRWAIPYYGHWRR